MVPVAVPRRSNQIAVRLSDELQGYLLGAHRFTIPMIRATAEVFIRQLIHKAALCVIRNEMSICAFLEDHVSPLPWLVVD